MSQTNQPFEPVRPVVANPGTRVPEETASGTRIVDMRTAAVADLFNGAYDTMLLMLRRFFTQETDADLERLARASLRLMTTVIRPLGEALSQMPVDSASLPGRCAGAPFGDDGNIPELVHQSAVWALLDERLWQLALAATKLRVTPGLPAEIQEATDGPYRVTGGIPLKDGRGNDEPRNTGASREHYSLCRCGHSQNKPFCSGMHFYVNFHDPQVDAEHEPTLFEWVGGLPTLLRMTHLFYDKYVPQDPLLEPLFAGMSPDHPERVAAWLGEVFGGPRSYSEVFGGYSRMISQHVGRGLTEAQRARWVSLLLQSADEAGLPADPEFRSAFVSYLEWGSRIALENSQTNARPPEHMPMPHWNWGTAGPPGSRISALAPVQEEQKTVALPSADEAVRFSLHIKPLFRQMDRQSMKWAFDLWSYQDVQSHATGILQRLQNGSMPCDGAWPHEKVEVFRRWVESGMQE